MTDQTTTLEKIETQSSIFEKTDPDFRRRLDQAIIDHDPPTYKALHAKFDLAGKDISLAAFYRNAGRHLANQMVSSAHREGKRSDYAPLHARRRLRSDADPEVAACGRMRTMSSLVSRYSKVFGAAGLPRRGANLPERFLVFVTVRDGPCPGRVFSRHASRLAKARVDRD